MAKLKNLAHVGVFVDDIERSKKFYQDLLGFSVTWECDQPDNVKIAFVQNGSVILELVQFPKPLNRSDGVVDHIAIAVEDIESIKKTLDEKGIIFESNEIVYGKGVFENDSKWILFRGPDNEHLELTEVL